MKYTPRLKSKYEQEVLPALMNQFGYSTPMQAPRLLKIVLNQGIGGGITDKKLIETGAQEMTLISGQKAVMTKSKKDISN
ncbi:MAG: 50S ribosomal protein L5, partial [Bacteroidales bacterium]|nr:50S ribosomal protein L5 [Bacteroidales bacterium]